MDSRGAVSYVPVVAGACGGDRTATGRSLHRQGGPVEGHSQAGGTVARPAGTPVRPRDMGYSCTRDMGGASGEEKGLDDDALAILKDCVHLTELDVRSTRVTEKGLEIFRGRSNFTSLGLAYLRVTD